MFTLSLKKSMKILLINPPVFNDVGRCKSNSPPLSLLYLAGYLEKYGYADVKIIDAAQAKITWSALGDLLVKENPDIIGTGGSSYLLQAIIKTAEIARNRLPNCLIVAGGFGPTKEPEKVLKEANRVIDFVVMGEGEVTLLELVKQRESGGKNFNDIAGLAFLNKEGDLIITKPRDYIMDLDSIPWPAFHLLALDFSKYPGAPFAYNSKYKELPRPVATLLAARGCPHRCTFCSLGSKMYRQRNPKDVVEEIAFYKNKFGVKSIQIYDDEFVGMSPAQNEWVKEICREMIKKDLRLPWLVQGRCSQFIDLETLKIMKEAGCIWIWWGVESGSQKVLDNIHKDIKIENVYRAFALAKEAGIKSLMFLMVGLPGQTPADIKLSIELVKKIKPDDIGIHITTPFPGSELRRYLEVHNLLENKLATLADYYKLDTDRNIHHHTEEMTAAEIVSYFKLLVFSYKYPWWYFIKFGLQSLTTIDGWKKLSKRTKIIMEYFWGWLQLKFN